MALTSTKVTQTSGLVTNERMNSLQSKIFEPDRISILGAYLVAVAPVIIYLVTSISDQFPATSLVSGWPEMTPVTAILFTILGVVTVLKISDRNETTRTVLKFSGLLISSILLVIAAISKFTATPELEWIELPSIATSSCFSLLFFALFTTRRKEATVPLFLSLIVLTIATTRLVRLLVSGPEPTVSSIFDTMALTTAALFAVSAVSAILLNPRLSYHRLFLATHDIGQYARLGVLITVVLPIFVVVTTLSLKDSQNVSIESTLTLTIVVTITVISAAVYKLLYRLYNELSNNQILQIELHQSNTLLENFARTASHDLQEPARKVRLLTQLITERLPEKSNDAELNDALNRLQSTARWMNELITNILQYSTTQPNQSKLKSLQLDSVLQDVFETLSELIHDTGTTINTQAMPEVIGNASGLHQVFLNLIINAIKYRPSDQPADIKIYAERIKDRYCIYVEDNGIGMDADSIQSTDTANFYSSYGIGIDSTKRILEMHDSELHYHAKLAQGTIASFTLKAG